MEYYGKEAVTTKEGFIYVSIPEDAYSNQSVGGISCPTSEDKFWMSDFEFRALPAEQPDKPCREPSTVPSLVYMKLQDIPPKAPDSSPIFVCLCQPCNATFFFFQSKKNPVPGLNILISHTHLRLDLCAAHGCSFLERSCGPAAHWCPLKWMTWVDKNLSDVYSSLWDLGWGPQMPRLAILIVHLIGFTVLVVPTRTEWAFRKFIIWDKFCCCIQVENPRATFSCKGVFCSYCFVFNEIVFTVHF